MILLVAAATVICTFLGGLFAFRFKDRLHLVLGFSAGAVMGVALFDLIPESFELSAGNYQKNLVTALMSAGFVIYLLIDRFFSLHGHGEDDENCQNVHHRGRFGAAALSFHSFLDGLGIGLAFKVSPEIGWIVAAAVLVHDFSDGINTVSMILKSKGQNKEAIKWLIVDALAPVLGVITTLFITVSMPTLGLILALFTGLFLYIGASDLVPESHHRHPTVWTSFMTILGIALLYLAVNLAK